MLDSHLKFICFREDIVGCLLTKDLVLVNPSDALPTTTRTLREMPFLSADAPMFDALNLFQVAFLVYFHFNKVPSGLLPMSSVSKHPES